MDLRYAPCDQQGRCKHAVPVRAEARFYQMTFRGDRISQKRTHSYTLADFSGVISHAPVRANVTSECGSEPYFALQLRYEMACQQLAIGNKSKAARNASGLRYCTLPQNATD